MQPYFLTCFIFSIFLSIFAWALQQCNLLVCCGSESDSVHTQNTEESSSYRNVSLESHTANVLFIDYFEKSVRYAVREIYALFFHSDGIKTKLRMLVRELKNFRICRRNSFVSVVYTWIVICWINFVCS